MTFRLSGGLAQPISQSAWLGRAPFSLILGPPEHQKREQEGARDPRQPKSAFQDMMLLVFVPALFWLGSTDVRKLARQRKCCNFIYKYRVETILAILRTSRTM